MNIQLMLNYNLQLRIINGITIRKVSGTTNASASSIASENVSNPIPSTSRFRILNIFYHKLIIKKFYILIF